MVNFQQVVIGHKVFDGVEVADVGHQETQGVADAAVSVDYAGQDFVVDVQVTRVIGCSHPQAHNFCAHFVSDFLGGDGVAQALAHLAALTVSRKAMGQKALVGRAAVQGTA